LRNAGVENHSLLDADAHFVISGKHLVDRQPIQLRTQGNLPHPAAMRDTF
jgi:hypothetical protein